MTLAVANPSFSVVADFNADAEPDLAVTNTSALLDTTRETVTILLGNSLGGFSSTADLLVGQSPESMTVGGFDA